jgi:hypothetical protein
MIAPLLVLVVSLPWARPALAQCVPDGLNVAPCCTPLGVNLPGFPAIAQSIRYLCFNQCSPQINVNLCVDVDPPQSVTAGGGVVCGIYLIRYRVRLCSSGQLLWSGTMRAHYSRNWVEVPVTGQTIGVWRFLLNGNLVPSSFLLSSAQAGNPCVIPTCFPVFNSVYFTGYIDYAFHCQNQTWSAAWALTHDCDAVHHSPTSARPAPASGLHATRSFVFVGPGPSFVVNVAAGVRSDGPIVQGAARWNDWMGLPAICRAEEPLGGVVQALNEFCHCGVPGTNPPQYIDTAVNAMGACGTVIDTPLPPIVPFLQKRIGTWTDPAVFPGEEVLFLDRGEIRFTNSCTGVSAAEFFEGVETIGGYPALTYNGDPLGRQFEDMGSANRGPNNLAVRVGAPHVSHYLFHLNLP